MTRAGSTTKACLLIATLREPARVNRYSPSDWDILVRQARSANLLANLGHLFAQHQEQIQVPDDVRRHLESAQRIVKRQNEALRWEIRLLRHALYEKVIPVIVLKGTAYVLAGLPNGNSRLFHDIDILVPRSALEEVEATLRRWGWRTTHNNAYDQRYYRRWMHELPPMKHQERQTVLDVHHSILPLTAHIHPDPRAMIDKAVPDPDNEDIYWLSPEDMILHSMTHLFHDGELENGLRDLVDIRTLLEHFQANEEFWPRLCERARLLELTRPLYYGLRYVRMIFDMPVPAATLEAVSAWGPGMLLGKLTDGLFLEGLKPVHATCSSPLNAIARRVLYIRSHYLRMPLRLLLPHLLRKSLVKNPEDKISKELRKIIDDNP